MKSSAYHRRSENVALAKWRINGVMKMWRLMKMKEISVFLAVSNLRRSNGVTSVMKHYWRY